MKPGLKRHPGRPAHPEDFESGRLPNQYDRCRRSWTRHEDQYILPETYRRFR
jgi:hypothetical protein